jgi:hypothetical protein
MQINAVETAAAQFKNFRGQAGLALLWLFKALLPNAVH